MGNSNGGFRNFLFYLTKVSFPIALFFVFIAFVLGWIGFAVPDWLGFSTILGYQRKFGLWTVCTLSLNFFSNGYSCSSWYQQTSSNPLPDFLRTTQALCTIGMTMVTLAALIGFLAIFLRDNIFKLFPLMAGMLSFIGFLLLLIGVSTFAGDYHQYIVSLGGYDDFRRWGHWLVVIALIALIPAFILFPIKTIDDYLQYKRQIKTRFINQRVLSSSDLEPSFQPPMIGSIRQSFRGAAPAVAEIIVSEPDSPSMSRVVTDPPFERSTLTRNEPSRPQVHRISVRGSLLPSRSPPSPPQPFEGCAAATKSRSERNSSRFENNLSAALRRSFSSKQHRRVEQGRSSGRRDSCRSINCLKDDSIKCGNDKLNDKQVYIPEIRQSNLEKRFVSEEVFPIDGNIIEEIELEPCGSVFYPGAIAQQQHSNEPVSIVKRIKRLLKL